MSLQFILGCSGAGKTHYLTRHILEESKKNPDTKYILIVPEQYSLQMKKDVVAMSGEKGVLNVDVLSFMRLAYRVFEERAGKERTILDDVGVSMVLRKVLMRKRKELVFFGGNCDKPGFVGEVKSILSEFIQYNVGVGDLDEMIRLSEGKPMLKGKLSDVQMVYREFRSQFRDGLITAEDVFSILVKEAGESETIRDNVVCIDGFMGFTPSQYELLAELMRVCKKVYITITADPNEDVLREGEKHELFYNSRKHIRRCHQLAIQNRVVIEDHHIVGWGKGNASYRLKDSPALYTIERNLFRYPPKSFTGETEGIQIHSLLNPESEVRLAVKETMRLVREERYRYRDFAIVTGDIENYGRIVKWEMEKAGIPCFVDVKKEVASNSFVEAVLSILEMLRKDFDYESVFRFLRLGYTDMERAFIDRLENYVLANGVRGLRRYGMVWKDGDGLSEGLNPARERLYQLFQPLKDATSGRKRTVEEYTATLYEFLSKEMNAFDRVEGRRKEFEEKGEGDLAKEYGQIYSIVVETMERLVELLGEERVTIKEYEELFKAGFMEAKVGLVPPSIDQVMVGDVERSRLKDVKVLFFLGMNDGIIPKKTGGAGILSDMEREYLLKAGRELALSERDRIFLQQFYLYLSLTKPRDRLYLTFAKLDMDGKMIRASQMVGKIRALFPDLPVRDGDGDDPLGTDMGMRHMVEGLRRYPYEEMDSSWKEVYRFHFINQKREPFQEMVKNAFYQRKKGQISREAACGLYGNELTGSVSRMERYAACAYAYFLAYGLRLSERKEFGLGMADLGERFHRVMETFSGILNKNRASWRTITKEQLEEWGDKALELVQKEQEGGVFEDSMRNAYIMKRIRRISKWTLYSLCEQARMGRFEEVGFELAFEEAGKEKEDVRLKGRIDRLEVCEDEGCVYVKVVDYKTGNTEINLLDLYYGLQIQLVVYLDQAMKYIKQINPPDKAVIPAGVFYYQIKNPIIDRPKEDGDVEGELLAQMVPNGIINRDKRVISLMDEGFIGEDDDVRPNYKSFAIPLGTTRSGSFKMNDKCLDADGFRGMVGYVKEQLEKNGNEILGGRITVNPYKNKGATACDYCPYLGVCGFDGRLPDNHFRELKKVDVRTMWEDWGEGREDEVDG